MNSTGHCRRDAFWLSEQAARGALPRLRGRAVLFSGILLSQAMTLYEARTTPFTPANRHGTTWTTRCTAWEHLQVETDGLFEVKVVDKAVD